MLKLFVDWLEAFYMINRNKLRLRLHLRDLKNEIEIKKHWSEELSVPIQNFTKSWVKTKSTREGKHDYGLCRVSIDSKNVFMQIIQDIENEFLS